MGYSLAVGVLAGVAALAAERIAGFWNAPRRSVWLAAMVLTALVPLALATRRPAARPTDLARVKMERAVALASAQYERVRRPRPVRAQLYALSQRIDRPLREVWGGASLVVAIVFVIAIVRVRRERSSWSETKLSGHRVLVTEDVGPALVGFLNPRIVIPRWALDLTPMERRFMLRHELEHLGAEDPRLLLVAGLLLVVFPWNAALWWMTQRLRLAIEIDCDTRVVQTCGAPREYGLFLLAVGERRTRALPLAASLAERRSLLERRIRAMTMQRPRYPLLASLPLAGIMAGAVTLAAQTPQPPVAGAVLRASPSVAPANRIQLSTDQIRSILSSQFPGIVSGASDDNVVTVVISTAGDLVATGATRTVGEARIVALKTALDSAERTLVEHKLAVAGVVRAAPISGGIPADSAGKADLERTIAAKVAAEGMLGRNEKGMVMLAGIGEVDPTLIRDTYWLTFEPGQVSANGLRVRVVTIAGNSTK
jgi:beta-lactamase regulating signal transducer with metallopeptidase domain